MRKSSGSIEQSVMSIRATITKHEEDIKMAFNHIEIEKKWQRSRRRSCREARSESEYWTDNNQHEEGIKWHLTI